MKEKIFSIIFGRLKLPSILELKLALRGLYKWEKLALLGFSLILAVGLLGMWTELQKKFALVVPVEGGLIREGVIGTPQLVNPVLASTDADRDLTALIYSGLMKPDGRGGLEKDLAESYSISEDGLEYTFTLKENLSWHDGEKLTSEDIAFTIQAVRVPAIKSPARANWEGVEVEIVDPRQVRFLLKKPYAPFLENAILGILPKHIWNTATPEQFSLSEFNREPLGAGPYRVDKVRRNSAGIITMYELKSFKDYALGRPLIPKIEILFYNSASDIVSAFERGDINAVSSISAENEKRLRLSGATIKKLVLPRVFGVFFNQNKSEVLRDQAVRKSLNLATDREALVRDVLGGYGVALKGPIPHTILDPKENADGVQFGLEEAKAELEKAGWKTNDEGIRQKKKSAKESLALTLAIATANTPELVKSAEMLKSMWQELGAKVELKFFEIGDLNQNVIRPREYEGLLFGQVIGRDPDPFPFWHSSQRNDPGLNIALYANKTADSLIEAARAESDAEKRKEKYADFQKEVEKDLPAIFLYSPYYLYVADPDLKGFDTEMITTPAERFANVYRWHLYTSRVWKIFIR